MFKSYFLCLLLSGALTIPLLTQAQFKNLIVPMPPKTIRSEKEKLAYLTEHYWDLFNFKDGKNVLEPLSKETERAFVNYLKLSRANTLNKNAENLLVLSKKAAQHCTTYQFFQQLFRKYLYDPNAVTRSEALYEPLVKAYIQSKCADKPVLNKAKHDLANIAKNKVGTTAANFTYKMANGKTGKLEEIKSPMLLLLFYNPECESCAQNQENLIKSKIIKNLQRRGHLQVLAVYVDFNAQAWAKHKNNIPKQWLSAYDLNNQIKRDKLYDLNAIPSMYLLNEKKQVILKDANFEQIQYHLSR